MTSRFDVEYRVSFGRGSRGAGPADLGPPRLSRITRLMALAIRCEQLIRTGVIKDNATLAKIGGVSRARISQIMSLIQLAPSVQEALLFMPPIQHGRARPGKVYVVFASAEEMNAAAAQVTKEHGAHTFRLAGQANTLEVYADLQRLLGLN